MIRSYHTLACAMLGMVLMVLVQRGLDLYLFLALALAIPWDKLAEMTGDLAVRYIEWGRDQRKQEVPEAAISLPELCDKSTET